MKASALFLRTAVLAVLVGVCLGIGMGLSHDFTLSPVHAHINLIGWASMFLFGLYYKVTPAADTRFAMAHYGFATAGLVLLNAGLTVLLLHGDAPLPGLAWVAGAACTTVSALMFAWTVFASTAERREADPSAAASLQKITG